MPRQLAALAAGIFLCSCATTSANDTPRVLIAGDSTASSYPAPRAPQTGWGQVLGYFFIDDAIVLNRAVSGRSTKSYIDEGKWEALVAEMRPGDIVLISFGHNDSRDDAPERYTRADREFRDNLARFARETKATGAIPVILSPAARRLWEGPAMVETHGLYALNAGLAADEAAAHFIDLSNLSIAYLETLDREQTKHDFLWLTLENANERFPEGVEDNTHFTALGACGVARVIAIALADIPATRGIVDAARIGPDAKAGVQVRPPAVLDCESRTVWFQGRE
jgi:lysophospholipase L1-like esterase